MKCIISLNGIALALADATTSIAIWNSTTQRIVSLLQSLYFATKVPKPL